MSISPWAAAVAPLPRQLFNLLVVWTLTGFWHGADWTFLCWGLYSALLLMGERYVWGGAWKKLPRLLRHLLTLLLVALGWLLFRAPSLSHALHMLPILFGSVPGLPGQAAYYLLEFRWELLFALVCVLPVKPWLEKALAARQDKPGPAG